MILSQHDFDEYVEANYPDVTDSLSSERRIFEYCPYCKARMGLDIIRRYYVYKLVIIAPSKEPEKREDYDHPNVYVFRCPDCKAERRWYLYEVHNRMYRIMSIPGDSGAEIDELPLAPVALRKAYGEAIRALDANCPMAAAAMIRRTLQVITRDILGAPAGNLGVELKWLQGNPGRSNTPALCQILCQYR